MLKLSIWTIFLCSWAAVVRSQSALYGQCGGDGWTGPKTCVSGSYCSFQNQWYSQCLPGSAPSTAAPATASTAKAASSTAAATTAKAASSTAAATTTKAASSTAAATTSGSSSSSYTSKGSSFINGKFRLGIDYSIAKSLSSQDLSQYDYVTIWLNTVDLAGSTAWNPWYQGLMLELCNANNKYALFYAYVIAFEARSVWKLRDCDDNSNPNPSLCQKGSEFIRQYRQRLVDKYTEHSTQIALKYGKDKPVVFVMEPDFWQYYGDTTTQYNGVLTLDYAKALFKDFISAIKAQLPNALISWDISAWIGEQGFSSWWSNFKDLQIDFIHTSGGQAHAELPNLKPNELTWSFVSKTTGKKIIADCGYGVNGGLSDNCNNWSTAANQNARIQDGVVALSIANPKGPVAKSSVSCC